MDHPTVNQNITDTIMNTTVHISLNRNPNNNLNIGQKPW